jgi:hypothetical protein
MIKTINTIGRTLLIIILLICYVPFIIVYTIITSFKKPNQDVS